MVLVYGVGRIDKLVVGMKNKRPICFVGLILLESMELVGLIYVGLGLVLMFGSVWLAKLWLWNS